ncbi:type 2 lantibiotic biosynthesis protein LanM [Salibacterium halotolerans]|uniref:Type 2 lantibiotic biosynthesis protein LanM n=2 Tax=Salibacterium halotolerans TaxID=1884432 RepID=A0A1I5WSP5_9BACI|nr:type 2 lantibiotic biosynthesis protein LanM [Salibacterium halotolerans]
MLFTDILKSREKIGQGDSKVEGTLFNRNIDIVYKGDTKLIEESLINVLDINSLEKVYRLYATTEHDCNYRIKFYQYIKEQLSRQEIIETDLSDNIMFHTFGLKICTYFAKDLINSHKFKKSRHIIKNEDKFLEDISDQFQRNVLKLSYRTLVFDLNVNKEKKTLQGNSKEEKYRYYNEKLLNDADYMNQFFELYPTLLRVIANEIRKFKKITNEVLSRYDKDKWAIARHIFHKEETEQIETIEMGQGDSHCDGKKVAKLILENHLLIYKPRLLTIDLLYQELTHFVNEKIGQLQYHLYNPQVLSRKNYGWMEFVHYEECSVEEQVKNFYRRIGGQIALLYALNAVDFHSENLIANGSYPVLIDLESLFHIPYDQEIKTDAYDKAKDKLNVSVKALGLLPFFFGEKDVDISGIGRKGEVQSFMKLPQIKNPNQENMKIEREYVSLTSSPNHPKLNGEFVDSKEYLHEIENGFTKVYRVMMDNTGDILNKIQEFKEREEVFVRFIPKATAKYASFHELSLHPRFLHNTMDREVYLANIWKDASENQRYRPLAKHEYRDLINEDIPYFTLPIDSTDLWSSRNKCISDYFRCSPLQHVREKITNLSEEDLIFQRKLIGLSMLGTANDREKTLKQSQMKYPDNYTAPFVSRSYLVQKAEELAEVIYAESFQGTHQGRKNYSWINSTPVGVDEIQWRSAPMGDTLYNGLSGMALMYLSLWVTTKKQKYRETAEDIATDLHSRFQVGDTLDRKEDTLSIGAFTGISSIIYVLMNFYLFTQEEKYKTSALELTDKIPELLYKDKEFDIIGGAAGAIVVLINCYKETKLEVFLKTAAACGTYLMEHTVEINEEQVSWIGIAEQPLTGFSHGNAGIIYALSMLNDYLQDESMFRVITKGLNYENNQMIQNNWMDRRKETEEASVSSWCHGSPGILLSRMGLARSYKKSLAHQAEIDRRKAFNNIFIDGFGREHSLCHGDVGNAITLIEYGREANQPSIVETAQNLMLESVKNGEQRGYKCGVGEGVQAPNLMVGMAGIVYGLVFACDERVPNILNLKFGKSDPQRGNNYDV